MSAPYITVLTPTYNRAETLPRLAASLEVQSFCDFEWLVVDDGSTDGTAQLLSSLCEASSFPVRTIRCENGGKHRALNRGIPEVRSSWIFIVDSDDLLPADSLEKLARLARQADGDPSAGGVMGLKQTLDGRLVGERLPLDSGPRDAATLTFVDRIRGDKAEAFKTDVLRRYPFPEFEGERFITECVVWFRIARDGWKLYLSNEILYSCEYRADGLSARSLDLRLRNPEGTLLFYIEELALPFPGRLLLREAANLVRFAIHFRKLRPTLAGLPARGRRLALLALPVGAVAALADRARATRAS